MELFLALPGCHNAENLENAPISLQTFGFCGISCAVALPHLKFAWFTGAREYHDAAHAAQPD